MSKTFLMMAGGTGGHIFPALAVARVLQQEGHRVVWLGSVNSMEEKLVPQYDIELETVEISGIRGNGIKRKLMLPIVLSKAIFKARHIIQKHQINAVLGFGGFVSFPGAIAAKLSGIPLIIHEQNAIAGLSNKILSYCAQRVLYAFDGAFNKPDGKVGNPVRAEIAQLPTPEERFVRHTGSLNMLIVGGSLGAKVFNERVPEIVQRLPVENRPRIVHQCGKNNSDSVRSQYCRLGIEADCCDFIDHMPEAYATADFVICRAGALTVAELAAAGLGGFLVPFPFAVDDHQTYNAQVLVQVGAVECIAQDDFSVDVMAQKIAALTRDICLNKAKNAQKAAILDSAEQIAQVAIGLVHQD